MRRVKGVTKHVKVSLASNYVRRGEGAAKTRKIQSRLVSNYVRRGESVAGARKPVASCLLRAVQLNLQNNT